MIGGVGAPRVGLFDDFRVSSRYRIDEARREGLRTGWAKGHEQGLTDGKRLGYREGYQQGYDKGRADGTRVGRRDGLLNGLEQGREDGKVSGSSDGRREGYTAGFKVGLQRGLDKGRLLGLEEARRGLRDAIMTLVRERFGQLPGLFAERLHSITDLDRLRAALIALTRTRTLEEVPGALTAPARTTVDADPF